MLPEGVHIDLGGIGKGRAADLVAMELMSAGARGVCVSLGGETRHHLIDPRSGQPSQGSGRSVTVIAKDATSAEVLAKALYFLDPKDGAEVLNAHNATGVIIDDDGQAHPLSGFERFLA